MAAPVGKSRCSSCSRESGICKGRCCESRRITGWKMGQGTEDVAGELLELGKVAPRGCKRGEAVLQSLLLVQGARELSEGAELWLTRCWSCWGSRAGKAGL